MQVTQWLKQFESKRAVVKRQPPSYLPPPQELADMALEQAEAPLPTMDSMMEFHDSEMDLPKVTEKYYPGRGKAKSGAAS